MAAVYGVDAEKESYEFTVKTNTGGSIDFTKAVLPYMKHGK